MANFYYRYDMWVKTAQGPALAGVQVYVVNQPANTSVAPPSPLASVFLDPNGLFPITQPLQTDGFGHADFYVVAGIYTIVVAIGSVIQNVYPDQSIGTASLNGVFITGTPVAGQALIATGPTSASWQTIVGTVLNFPAVPNTFLNSYTASTGMFTSSQPILNGIGNPNGNVDFVFDAISFTRTYASSMQWNESLVNASVATPSQNYNSPAIALMGTVWNGSTSVADTWAMFSTVGAGTNPTSILSFQHVGSAGVASISVPNFLCYGNATFSGEIFDNDGLPGTAGQVLTSTSSGVVWAAGGGGGSTVFEANGTPLSSSSTINYAPGTGVAVTNPSAGNVLITNTAPVATFSAVGQGIFLGPGVTTSLYALNWEDDAAPLDDSANVVDVFQFTLNAAWTIRSCTFVWSNNLSGTASFGIYSVAGSLLIDSGTFNLEGATNTPVKNAFTAVVLPPGVYWFAQTASGAGINCPAFIWTGTSTPGAGVLAMLNTPQVTSGTAANPRSGGAMPATLGTVTAQSIQSLFPAACVWST